MAKSIKILPRTELFINQYNKLSKVGLLPRNVDLGKSIGIDNPATFSNILHGRVNISPEAWKLFQELYGEQEIPDTSFRDMYLEELKEKARILQELSTSLQTQALTNLSAVQEMITALHYQVKALAWYQAYARVDGDPVRIEEDLRMINNKVAELAGFHPGRRNGNNSDSGT